MSKDLKFEVVYPHPIEKVWRAITDSRAIEQWLMKNDFEARMGHRFQFRDKPQPGWDGIVNCEVLEVEPPRKLRYSWRGGPLDTQVTITLDAVAEGTRLILEHTGFRGLKARMVSWIMGRGWNSRILRKALPELLNRWDGVGPVPQGIKEACH